MSNPGSGDSGNMTSDEPGSFSWPISITLMAAAAIAYKAEQELVSKIDKRCRIR
jgi:hypothetical protein